MQRYKIFRHPDDGATEAVKQGWSWPAFFFSCFWAIAKKMWLTGTALFLASLLLGAVIGQAEMGPRGDGVINILSIAVSIIFGLKGNDWWEATLYSQGYEEKEIITAESPKGALAIFDKQYP
ncbi:DUF2628 domain-containing protein [Desulfogranum marinum]|jgi:hypothetical protein|uniref:DUF2628 domain-containing protein n=1 Tax=Desulfogranum marinum TaxID=453220 RepID=UPI001962BC3C|nr:DUF2628 domain-containing protein [Desulfogranum marinum]MBM9512402.1 DUF2628 domain-containing protein [Desulfogranum marinum]